MPTVKITPVHPGEVLSDYMAHAHLTVRALSRRLHVAPTTVGNILRKRSGISAEMAIRLSSAFSRPTHFWMMLQLQYDLHSAEKAVGRRIRITVKPVARTPD